MNSDDSFIMFLDQNWPRRPDGVDSESASEARILSWSQGLKTFGRFQVHRRLGSGGFATVYLAHDPQHDREVALKVPHPETGRSEDLRRRFEREARAAASLDHPHINPIYETSQSGAAELWIASHYCAGRTLADWLKHRLAPVAPRSAARLVATLARAVEHAHERGILHRDLKPSNVLLEQAGQYSATEPSPDTFEGFVPRLCDFGLARILQEALDDDRTRTGTLVGTPRYMAPEQAIGDSSHIGPTSDVYALGVILYELLVGRPPFVGDTELETLRQIRSDEPISIRRLQPRVPRDIDTIVLKCLEKEPARRYQSAADLSADLERFIGGLPTVARPRSLARHTRLWTRRHPVQAIVLLTGLLIALGIPAGLTWHSVGLERAFRVADEQRVRAQTFEAQSRRNEQAALAGAANVAQHVYASDMRLASELLKQGEFKAASTLIDQHDPDLVGGIDRRGFEWWYFRPFCEMAKHTWQAHSGELSVLAFSANGERLLTASSGEGRARIWNVSSGVQVAELTSRVSAALGDRCAGALSPDGKLAATVTTVNSVAVWNAETGQIVAQLKHSDRVRCVTFSPEGSHLLIGADDATRIWRLGNWQSCETELIPTRLAEFSPDGRVLAIVGASAFVPHIGFLDRNSREQRRVRTHQTPVVDFAYSPDGRMLGALFDSPDGAIFSISNADTGAWVTEVHVHDLRLRGISFSADGRLFATAAHDGGLRFWKPVTGQPAGGLRGAGGRISKFSFSSDGKWLATSVGGAVSLWDQSLLGGATPLEAAATAAAPVVFSPVENRVAVANTDRSIMVVDVPTSDVMLRMKGHFDPITDIAYSPDGRRLASVDRRHLRVWSTHDGSLEWLADAAGVGCLAWSPDGASLATGGDDHLVKLWDASEGVAGATFSGHTAELRCVRYTPDGKRLVTLGRENAVRTWDIALGKELGAPIVNPSPTIGLAVSRQDSLIATLSYDGTSALWRFSAQGSLERFGATFNWPRGFVPWFIDKPANLIFSADGAVLGRAGQGDIFVSADTANGNQLYALSGRGIAPTSAALSPDGQMLATVGRGNELTFWDTSTWHGRHMFGSPLPVVRALAFSPDGKTLLVAGDNAPDVEKRGYADFPAAPNVRLSVAEEASGSPARSQSARDLVPWQTTSDSLRLWEVESGREQSPLEDATTLTMLPSAAWSNKRDIVAAVARDGTLWAWNANRRAIVARRYLDARTERAIEARRSSANSLVPQAALANGGGRPQVAFSPDGSRLATLDSTGAIRLWSTGDWTSISTLPDVAVAPASLLFSPDGATLVVTTRGQARLYDPHTATLRRTLRNSDEPTVLCGAFSPDRKLLALGTINGNVKCYDFATGDLSTTLVGHVDGISSLCFSPDGRSLATGSWDATVRLWDIASGREVAVFEGHRGRIHSVAFSPDGTVLASGGEIESDRGEVFLWHGRRTTSQAAPSANAP